MGITIKTGVCFGRDITLAEIWQSGADAVILAVGTHKSTPLDIEPPKTIPGYLDCLTFLKTSRQPDIIDIGKKVIVVGGRQYRHRQRPHGPAAGGGTGNYSLSAAARRHAGRR